MALSRNLRPEAKSLKISAPEGSGAIDVTSVITMTTDPNNNIDMTNGFEMLSFPDDMADWIFVNGTLTILPLNPLAEPFQMTYRVCDNEKLCSDPASAPVPTPIRVYVCV